VDLREQSGRNDTLRRFEEGVRVALEEMLTGRDYARVETILRALTDQPSKKHNDQDTI
jgi:hypothetical protein